MLETSIKDFSYENTPPSTLGELIKTYRTRSKLTKVRLANLIGVKDPKTITEWENDKYGPLEDHIYKLIEVFITQGQLTEEFEAKALWQLACDKRNYKGYADDFSIEKVYSGKNLHSTDALKLVRPPTLSTVTPKVNELVTASFIIKNISHSVVILQELALCCRKGTDWDSEWADFPHAENITLRPGQEFRYAGYRKFHESGTYFAECAKLPKNASSWGGIPYYDSGGIDYPRLFFEVKARS